MKCLNCNSFDSMSCYVYIDKNKNVLSQKELKAFGIQHPEGENIFYEKVILCGVCYGEIMNRSNRILKGKRTPNPDKSFNTHYICPVCKTANEPLRKTCKKCESILFNIGYDGENTAVKSLVNHPYYKVFLAVTIILVFFSFKYYL